MTHASREELFRQAAEAEGGMPVSAGARVIHVRLAVESGRAFYVDLSGVPEDKRPALVAQIKELVNQASARAPRKGLNPAPDASNASG
jgi:hypothetical protein